MAKNDSIGPTPIADVTVATATHWEAGAAAASPVAGAGGSGTATLASVTSFVALSGEKSVVVSLEVLAKIGVDFTTGRTRSDGGGPDCAASSVTPGSDLAKLTGSANRRYSPDGTAAMTVSYEALVNAGIDVTSGRIPKGLPTLQSVTENSWERSGSVFDAVAGIWEPASFVVDYETLAKLGVDVTSARMPRRTPDDEPSAFWQGVASAAPAMYASADAVALKGIFSVSQIAKAQRAMIDIGMQPSHSAADPANVVDFAFMQLDAAQPSAARATGQSTGASAAEVGLNGLGTADSSKAQGCSCETRTNDKAAKCNSCDCEGASRTPRPPAKESTDRVSSGAMLRGKSVPTFGTLHDQALEWVELSRIALAARQSGSHPAMHELMKAGRTASSSSPLPNLALGWYIDTVSGYGRHDEAIALFEKNFDRLSSPGPQITNVAYDVTTRIAYCLESVGRTTDAIRAWQHAARIAWVPIEAGRALFSAAFTADRARRTDSAIELYKRAVKFMGTEASAEGELARRNAALLENNAPWCRQDPYQLAVEIAAAFRKRDASAIASLMSRTHFQAPGHCSSQFCSPRTVLPAVMQQLAQSPVSCDPLSMFVRDWRAVVPTVGWKDNPLPGAGSIRLQRTPQGLWQWIGLENAAFLARRIELIKPITAGPRGSHNLDRTDWSSTAPTNEITLKAPWTSGHSYRAGGTEVNFAIASCCSAAIIEAVTLGIPPVGLSNLCDSACGTWFTGYYYGQGDHHDNQDGGLFAIDFNRGNPIAPPCAGSPGDFVSGQPILAATSGVVLNSYQMNPGGGPLPNAVHLVHRWLDDEPYEGALVAYVWLTLGLQAAKAVNGSLVLPEPVDLAEKAVLNQGFETDDVSGFQPRYSTFYYHLDFASSAPVSRGMWIPGGTVIGAMDSTGHSDGPHLHFEVHDSTLVNPDGTPVADGYGPVLGYSVPMTLDGKYFGGDDRGYCLYSNQ